MASNATVTIEVKVESSILAEWATEAMIRAAEEEEMYPDHGAVARLAGHLRRGAALVVCGMKVSAKSGSHP